MSYIVKKYEFESEEQADTKISALEDKGHTFVKLGFLKKKKYSKMLNMKLFFVLQIILLGKKILQGLLEQ